ncbi:MAG TPA: acyl-ACP--UDP-N-acetylglucosamine O-acyltransferase [Tepidisphaeraceae bacterium]|nr:acyl-ACP--UDP-N-acetylglucosamine O-acyltransferase [Tepidisphaeraceae bacterium]
MKNEAPKPAPPTKRSPWFASLFSLRFFSDEMPKRSPHAVIDKNAEIAEDVEIGPFCVIGPDVKIDSGCRLLNSVTVLGKTTIGKDNVFFPNAVIGATPQDKKFKGETTELTIGTENVFREAVTIHVGTENGGGITRIGDKGLYMVNCHVGHDAQIENNVVIANNVMLAGHVVIHNNVAIMGGVGVHHFVTIGEYAYVGGYARIHHDVPPFCKVDGADTVRGINTIGLRRAGVPDEEIEAIDAAIRELFSRKKPLALAMSEFNVQNGLHPSVKRLLEFLDRRSEGKHGRYLEGLRVKAPQNE